MQANTALAFRGIQRFRPALHRRFRRAIGRRARGRDKGRDGRHHSNTPAQPIRAGGLRRHDFQRRQGGIQDAGDIGFKKQARLRSGFRNAAGTGRNAGIGNHQIKPPGARDPARHGIGIAHIHNAGQHFGAARAAGDGGFLKPRPIAARQMQHHAGRGAGFRQGAAQAG